MNISPLEAKQDIDRLLRLGYIKSKLYPTGEVSYYADSFTSIDKRIATAATLKQQKAFLEKAFEARSQTTMTMAISKAHLKEDEKLIHQLRHKLTALMLKTAGRSSAGN